MLRYLYILTLLLIGFQSKAAEIVLSGHADRVPLGKYVEVLQPNKEIGFAEAMSAKFTPSVKDVPNIGLSPTSVWFRFTVKNQTSAEDLLLEIAYPILDEVELFSPDSSQHYKSTLMGEVLNFGARQYKFPNYVFNVHIPKDQSRTYYIRVKSSEQIILPISVSEQEPMWPHINMENMINGIYLGFVLIMVLYNLFIYFSVRDRSYLYYVIYVLFVGLTQLGIKGFNFQYLWPNNPAFELKSVVIFASVSGLSALLFARRFLNTRELLSKSWYIINALIGLFVVSIVLTLIGKSIEGFQVMQLTTTTLTMAVLTISCLIMIKGSAPAKYFFIAWSVLLTGAIVFLLKDYGVLPYNTFTSYVMQAASAIEMVLLSLGLADRINILKKEKEISQAEALEAAKENERIIREQNVILESKVEQRTVELTASNHELNRTLDDLKQAQSQLVESEKMASLGQLTAGIAHEINNPINFVTSNINPLKRDINMVFEMLEKVEEISASDLSDEEKKKQIEEYKEEIDFDYLSIEISHLLKGINEGASRTAEIVKGLRIFSRLDENDLTKADINEGIESTLVIARNLMDNKIKVTKHLGDLPMAECYAGKLNQVFLNIISNGVYAVKKQFGEKEGGELAIETAHVDGSIVIKIKDNGTGIDKAVQSKIFDPFFTTKDVGEGTGLGLSIVYNTIKKHNGKITVNSAPSQGTEFILEIPVIFEN